MDDDNNLDDDLDVDVNEIADDVDLEVDVEEDAPQDDGEEGEPPEDADNDDATETTDGLEVDLTGTAPEDGKAPAPAWVKDLRVANREKDKKIKELEAKLSGGQAPSVTAKPTLDLCDYNVEEFEAKLADWQRKQVAIEAENHKVSSAWQTKLSNYAKSKAALGVPDADEVEGVVTDALTVVQQAILIKAADRADLMVYALGKNPDKLKALSSITDPVDFAVAVTKLEAKMKVKRKPTTTPEKAVKGGTGGAPLGGKDSSLAKLRAEAERTGDMTKVVAYKAKLRKMGK